MEKKKIYCLDFDGTITTADTLLAFIRYAKGDFAFLLGFLLYSPLLVLMKLHLYPNWKAKQRLFSYFFRGMRIERFDKLCQDFALANQHLLRPAAVQLIHEACSRGNQVLVVSASIDNWVSPFFLQRNLQAVTVLGTKIEVEDGKVTGRFLSANCYGEEKVRRLCEALNITATSEERNMMYISAFGDSRGDKEMLAFADERHYKPFRI